MNEQDKNLFIKIVDAIRDFIIKIIDLIKGKGKEEDKK